MDYTEYLEWVADVKRKRAQRIELIKPILNEDIFKDHPHKKTVQMLGMLQTRLLWLSGDLITLSESRSIYSTKVLYRVFLEHWMKAMYLFIRYREEKSNNAIEEYYELGNIGEALKHGNSLKSLVLITDEKSAEFDVWQALVEKNPELKDIDKKKVLENISKFEYRSIAKFLIHKEFQIENVEKIVMAYPDLSSYVHGGAFALTESTEMYNNQFLVTKNIVEVSMMLSWSYVYAILKLMSKEGKNEHKQILTEVSDKLEKL